MYKNRRKEEINHENLITETININTNNTTRTTPRVKHVVHRFLDV